MNPHTVEPHIHKPKQHRDGKPPWCDACGLTETYEVPYFNGPIAPSPVEVVDIPGVGVVPVSPPEKKEEKVENSTAVILPEAFPDRARALVYSYLRETDGVHKKHPTFSMDEVRLVWFSKTLENWKALVITTLPDQRYYEVTHNGDACETYIDVYNKVDNVVIPD